MESAKHTAPSEKTPSGLTPPIVSGESKITPERLSQMMKNFDNLLRKSIVVDKEYEQQQAEIFKDKLLQNINHTFKGEIDFCYQIGVGITEGKLGLMYEFGWWIGGARIATSTLIISKLVSKNPNKYHELIYEWVLDAIKSLPCFTAEMRNVENYENSKAKYSHVVIVRVSELYLKSLREEVYAALPTVASLRSLGFAAQTPSLTG